MTPKEWRAHNHFRVLATKDKKYNDMVKELRFGEISGRLDELRRFAGIDRYSFSYFCPGFFTEDSLKSSRQSHFNHCKEQIRKRLKIKT